MLPQRILIVVVLCLAPFIATAQDQYQAHPHVQIFIGYEPYKQTAKKYTIVTGGELDMSVEKSILSVDQRGTKNAVTLGARVGALIYRDEDPFRMNFDLSGGVNLFAGSFYAARFGISFEPEFKRPTNPLGAFLGGSIDGYLIWGNAGEVGSSSSSDLYLAAPDGHDYPIGSKFDIQSNFLFGVSGYFGLRFYVGQFNNVFVLAGYQVAATAEKWNYSITDANDSEQVYKIPRNFLPVHPNPVVQDGPFFRLGFSFTP